MAILKEVTKPLFIAPEEGLHQGPDLQLVAILPLLFQAGLHQLEVREEGTHVGLSLHLKHAQELRDSLHHQLVLFKDLKINILFS